MNNPYTAKNAQMTTQYLEQQIQNASPAEQIVMLYDGAIKFLILAKQAIDRGDIESRCNANQRAINIVTYLMGILDDDKGGEVSQRLFKIYGHVIKLMMQIDFQNSPEPADEAIEHLKTLRASWVKIANPETLAEQQQPQAEQQGDTEGKSNPIPTKRSAIA